MVKDLELIEEVNRCEIAAIKESCKSFENDPGNEEACRALQGHVKAVEAVIVVAYKLVGFLAIRETNPQNAAELWKTYAEFCEQAIVALKDAKEKFPYCNTVNAYDLALDYWESGKERSQENRLDAEWQQNERS
jgi:hypothetical protein